MRNRSTHRAFKQTRPRTLAERTGVAGKPCGRCGEIIQPTDDVLPDRDLYAVPRGTNGAHARCVRAGLNPPDPSKPSAAPMSAEQEERFWSAGPRRTGVDDSALRAAGPIR